VSFELILHLVNSETKKVCGVERVSFTSSLGDHEILPMHEPLITELIPCQIKFSTEGGGTDSISLEEGGVLIFKDECCSVWAF
jgi:F0F1-type ATP synthase epsilon subunit